jgi:hypothetical protein
MDTKPEQSVRYGWPSGSAAWAAWLYGTARATHDVARARISAAEMCARDAEVVAVCAVVGGSARAAPTGTATAATTTTAHVTADRRIRAARVTNGWDSREPWGDWD